MAGECTPIWQSYCRMALVKHSLAHPGKFIVLGPVCTAGPHEYSGVGSSPKTRGTGPDVPYDTIQQAIDAAERRIQEISP